MQHSAMRPRPFARAPPGGRHDNGVIAMTVETFKSGGRFEEIGSYARAKRVGPFVYIAGTTAIEPSGKLHAPGDCYEQSVYIF